jgi:TolA-binding protein
MKLMRTQTLSNFWRVVVVFVCVAVVCIGTAGAQNPVEDNYRKAVQLMEESKWADAASVLQSVVGDYKQNAFNIYGPAFGLIHYHLGLCLMQLKKYGEAEKQFETTYKGFPNRIPKEKADQIPNTRNHYHLQALYRWGTAAQEKKEYEGAIKIYKKFESEKPEKGTYSPFELYINYGVCYARLAKIPEATEYLQKVYGVYDRINLRERWMLQNAFFDLAEKWIEKERTSDGMAFMRTNDMWLRFPPFDSYKYGFNQRLLKLAQEASGGEKNLDALALRFFSLTPRTEDAISELEDRKNFYKAEAAQKKVQQKIDDLQKTIVDGTAVDIPGLRLLASIYEKNYSLRSAYAIYDYMSRRYPTAKSTKDKKTVHLHPEIVYNATRCAFSIGDLLSAQHHGMNFLKHYPGHELEPQVQSMLMEQLFRRGDYLRCIKIASDILPKLPPKTPQHDLCLFCLGGSYYYDGQYEPADLLLERHATEYPESGFLEESSYYRGANKVKLLEWTLAAPLLEGWLTKYPESDLRPFAILDRATCHFAQDEFDGCLAKLDEIEQRFETSDIYDRSLNLRGDVLQVKKDWAQAEQTYLKGKARAEQDGHYQVAAEALSQLIPVATALENFKGAAGYYDEFVGNFAENYLEPQVVSIALEALSHESVNRGQEGLDKLEDMIDRLGRQENADLEKAITKYGDVSVDLNGAEPTINKLKAMATKGGQPDSVQAWLLVLRVDIIEKELEKGAASKAAIRTAFNELKSFDKKVLAPYVLAKIGDFLRNADQSPQAVPWFEEILGRGGIDSVDYAKNALAKIYFRGANPALHKKALDNVKWVLANSGNSKLMEESAYERALYYSRSADWVEAETSWFEYVSNKSWRSHSPEAWYRLGQARDHRGRIDKALSAYLQNYFKYPQYVEYSIPAMTRSAEIQKASNKGKEAYTLARMGGLRFEKKLRSDSRFKSDFNKLRKIYNELAPTHAEETHEDPFE